MPKEITMEDIQTKLDNTIGVIDGLMKRLEANEKKTEEAKTIAAGKNPEFEADLRKATESQVRISPSQRSLYGPEAPEDMINTVRQVLGADFQGFYNPNKGLPNGLFTILVPERLSNKPGDFRSTTIYEATAQADVKRWSELVKKHIFKTWSSESKGTPDLMIRKA